MSQKLKDVLLFLVRIGLSGLLLWYIFSRIDTEKTVEVLKAANLSYVFLAAVIFFLLNFILLFRWYVFIKALDLKVSLMSVFRYFFIGLFGNLFLPSSIGGDIIKIVGLCRETPHKAKVVASVLLDRLSGFAAIVLIAVTSFILGYKLIGESSLLIPIVILALGSLLVALFLFNGRVYGWGCAAFNKIPKIKSSLMQLHYDIMLLQHRKVEGFKAIGLSCVSQIVFAFVWFLIAKALGQNISIFYFLIFVPLICVSASVPSIGGLGVREAGAAYLFAKAGMDAGIAVSISLMSFLFMVLVGLIGGAIYVITLSSGRIQHHSSNAPVRPTEA